MYSGGGRFDDLLATNKGYNHRRIYYVFCIVYLVTLLSSSFAFVICVHRFWFLQFYSRIRKWYGADYALKTAVEVRVQLDFGRKRAHLVRSGFSLYLWSFWSTWLSSLEWISMLCSNLPCNINHTAHVIIARCSVFITLVHCFWDVNDQRTNGKTVHLIEKLLPNLAKSANIKRGYGIWLVDVIFLKVIHKSFPIYVYLYDTLFRDP